MQLKARFDAYMVALAAFGHALDIQYCNLKSEVSGPGDANPYC